MKKFGWFLLIALVVTAGYFAAVAIARDDAGLARTQPDVFFYCQAARRIVEGHAFSFSEGTAVSTGTTTVLYPFLLAVPYALGLVGDNLLYASFALNAVFYLFALWCWWCVACRRLPDAFTRNVFMLLLVFAGQFAYAIFDQSDIGFFIAVASALAAALAAERRALALALLVVLPWVRPEGMFLVFAFTLVTLGARLLVKDEEFRHSSFSIFHFSFPLASCLGVFLFNYFLTGSFQFSSVAQKGYFKTMDLLPALSQSCADAWATFKLYFLGVNLGAEPVSRSWYFPPLVFAAMFWLGAAVHDWRRRGVAGELVFIIAALGGFASIVTSGWQGTNMDRYLAWVVPLMCLFAAEGCGYCARRIPNRFLRYLPSAMLVALSAICSVVMLVMFKVGAVGCDLGRAFAAECERKMEKGAAVGVACECSVAYEFSPRRTVHLMGIYSPEMHCELGSSPFEILKHEPEKRFDYWYDEMALRKNLGTNLVAALGEKVLEDREGIGYALIRADWSAFDAAAVAPELEGYRLAGRLDVAYDKDEKEYGFEIIGRKRAHQHPFLRAMPLEDGRVGIDSGVVAPEGIAFDSPFTSGSDAVIVLRTLGKVREERTVGCRVEREDAVNYTEIPLSLSVGGEEIVHATVRPASDRFTDFPLFFTLPARMPADGPGALPARFKLEGDFAALGLWFYERLPKAE